MFRFPFKERLISRFCWELLLFGSEELKRLKVKKSEHWKPSSGCLKAEATFI